MRTTILLLFVAILLSREVNSQRVKAVHISSVDSLIKAARQPLLINFWATWCQPCVEEIPGFIKMAKSHSADSLQLLLVSLDTKDLYPVAVTNFITARNWEGRFFWLNETNADYFCPVIDSSWSGAIPASLFINPHNGYRFFTEAKISESRLSALLKDMLKRDDLPAGNQ